MTSRLFFIFYIVFLSMILFYSFLFLFYLDRKSYTIFVFIFYKLCYEA